MLTLSAFLSLRRDCLLGLKWPSSQGFSSSRIVVTIGYSPDFAVLPSKTVKMNIPRMVRAEGGDPKRRHAKGGAHPKRQIDDGLGEGVFSLSADDF
jgi:hypothetical protein